MAEGVKNEALEDASRVSDVISDKEIMKIEDFRCEIYKRLKAYDEEYCTKKNQ